MTRYRVLPTFAFIADMAAIADHLNRSHLHFGDDPAAALGRARVRVRKALDYTRGLAGLPHRGTRVSTGGADLRCVTSNDFVFYFEVIETAAEVRILAVFFGGADHRSQIIDRLGHS